MFKNKFGEDSPIPKFIHLKIQRRDGIESLMTHEEGEFKVPIDSCINGINVMQHIEREDHAEDLRPLPTKWETSRKISFKSYKQIHDVQTLSFKMIYNIPGLLPY